jgi:hypothetical protein
MKFTPLPEQEVVRLRPRIPPARHFKLDLTNDEQGRSLDELMSSNSWTRRSLKRQKRKTLSITLQTSRSLLRHGKKRYQLRLSRKLRPVKDLLALNYFPDLTTQISSNADELYPIDDVDESDPFHPSDNDNPFPEQLHYEFTRPVHYDKIEFDKNFAKVDAKKLQIRLYDEYNLQNTSTPSPVSLSSLCMNLIEQGIISCEKDQIVSAFYCMLNNCNKNQLYMKNTLQRDDLVIQKQPFVDSTQLTYSQSLT